jgi:1-acyl-sn-glycerol-3-phosphate acyltransferase
MLASIKSGFGSFVLWCFRWKVDGVKPSSPKYVLVCVPHTTNWDFVFFLALGWKLKIKARWLGKKSLFKPPFGWFMRATGGIRVDRSNPEGLVEELTLMFKERDFLALAVPPSGSRSKREYWKSGFLRIAKAAEVPVVFGYLDFTRKRGGFMDPVELTGNLKEDMDLVRHLYRDIHSMAKHPEKVTPIRLRSEGPAPEDAEQPSEKTAENGPIS